MKIQEVLELYKELEEYVSTLDKPNVKLSLVGRPLGITDDTKFEGIEEVEKNIDKITFIGINIIDEDILNNIFSYETNKHPSFDFKFAYHLSYAKHNEDLTLGIHPIKSAMIVGSESINSLEDIKKRVPEIN